ncbi:hypothetical protein C0993_009521 [Termitomyces sp. T159_Od127]|nr:hypothetical protein C0993_009521 [Termitomyces sp. T159_Od127]
MVAALNSWWPDGQIFRSTDSGTTWCPLWAWSPSYPTMPKYYSYNAAPTPWLGPNSVDFTLGDLQIGWMVEETSVQGLVAPPSGPILYSALGDIEGIYLLTATLSELFDDDITGFVHSSLTTPPTAAYTNPKWSTCADIDYAGLNPAYLVRIGTGDRFVHLALIYSFTNHALHYAVRLENKWHFHSILELVGRNIMVRPVMFQANQATFSVVSSLPSTAVIAADKKTSGIFYGASGSSFYISNDNGNTFTMKGSLGSSSFPVKIVVHPNVTGDIWVSSDKGLYHSTDSGATFNAMSGIDQTWAIALGAPSSSGGYPALFAAANAGGTIGYFRSDDQGVNWVQINDAAHGFGSVGANVITADLRTYGRYVSSKSTKVQS